jgi:hypothetical protein
VAVVDEAWLAVWWPWLLVWVATVALLVAAGLIVVTHRRGRTPGSRRPGMAIYLDEEWVMTLYRQYGGKDMPQEVQERVSSTRDVGASAQLAPVEANVKRGVTEEVSRTYREQAAANTVISIIIDVLAREDDIVDVDLSRQEVEPSAALTKALGDGLRGRAVELEKVRRCYVSIFGWFEVPEDGDSRGITTFEAPFGGPDGPADTAKVRIVCPKSGRRGDHSAGWARCLGKVDGWNADERMLYVRPIAVFR